MEPFLTTGPALAVVLEELTQREPIFHRPKFGRSRTDFENMMHSDFWEIGVSGKRYSREYVLSELEKRFPHNADSAEGSDGKEDDIWETSDFHCRQLAPDIYLLTYTLLQDHIRKTRRTTLWQRSDAGWKILFHQGTVVQEP
ncbi:DUF4440 domain-containing protein [Granulicella sp. L60]|jgi:hypothetical protein|uniref:nuclear transport factor 2 family protein n=1 Tax=Granulicella sp. L60 TaxID=1641866 RepID=UPI00131AEC16|nr:DUF4440 domain-containing protein [Granulicella sp. L60]